MKGQYKEMKEPSPLEWVIVIYDDKWHNPVGNDGIIFTGCTSYHDARKKLERLDIFKKIYKEAKYVYPMTRGMWKSVPQDDIDKYARQLNLNVDDYIKRQTRS